MASQSNNDVALVPFAPISDLHKLTRNNDILNPCSRHPFNEIEYLDKTSKQGVCSICLPTLVRISHELLPVDHTVREVSQVLNTLDEQMVNLRHEKQFRKEQCADLKQLIEADRQAFEMEQTSRINQLKNYLDDRLRTAINEYRKATEPDFYKVKGHQMLLEDQLTEIQEVTTKIHKMKVVFKVTKTGNLNSIQSSQYAQKTGSLAKVKITNVVSAIDQAGKLLSLVDDTVARLSENS